MKLYLLSVLLIFSFSIIAQPALSSKDSLFFSKTLTLKLKKEQAHLQSNDGIRSDELNHFIDLLDTKVFERIFPNHLPPETSTNSYGDSLIDLSLYYILEYEAEMVEELVISKLIQTQLFDYVEKRPRHYLLYIPNDTLLENQYYPQRVQAFDAWDIEKGDSNVVIGIVDSGTDLLGEDLKDGIKINYADPIDGVDNDNDGYVDNYWGWDFGDGDNNPQSYGNHHGCFTTGISSARADNNVGIAGMGFNSKYLPVKHYNTDGYLYKTYESLVYAADHGAQIINNSWGGWEGSRFGQDIVNYATYNRNALVVCAAGNSANDAWIYPSAYENAIACAATDSIDHTWQYTSYGTHVDISAPGDLVYSTWTANGYFNSSGTSFSSPGVAGAAALVKARYPHMSALQLGEQLRVTADNIDTISSNAPFVGQLGAGRLNMYHALVDTTSPSIRFRDRVIQAESFMPGDTIHFSGRFQNLLAPSSSSLNVAVSSSSPYLSIINPIRNIGMLSTMASTDNYSAPFLLKIAQNTPAGTVVDLKLTYSDTAYTGFEYFRFKINPDFYPLDTNHISASIASNGTLGYVDATLTKGQGLYYKNSDNLLAWAGLVIGNSAGKVSSNIYGDNGFDNDFESVSNIEPVTTNPKGDQDYISTFNDDNANFTKLNVEVEQRSYALAQEAKDVIFLEYTVKNTSSLALSSLHIGFYADFDIDVSYKNKAYTDTSLRLAYTRPEGFSGIHAGIMLLDTLPWNVYQLDNDGVDNSLNLYDGFPDFEKFTALTTRKDSAGYAYTNGNDVSTMLSAGPFNLLPGDSQKVCFAIVLGSHESSMKQAAIEALNKYTNAAPISYLSESNMAEIYPNPFTHQLNIRLPEPLSQSSVLEIYNESGSLIRSIPLTKGKSYIQVFESQLSKGKYWYSIQDTKRKYSGSIIKL
jgi:serine protease